MEVKSFYNDLTEEINVALNHLYKEVFDDEIDFNTRIKTKQNVITIVAIQDTQIVGFKMGYEKEPTTFYSWLGGVSLSHRRQGIAQLLLDELIKIIISEGYDILRTKTYNRWKSMLIFNLKNNFNIVDVIKEEKDTAIILEKSIR